MKQGSFGNKGGIYMGLGLVRDRLGKTKEALPILHQALDHYQREHTRGFEQLDSSIIAKVRACGKHTQITVRAQIKSLLSSSIAEA